MQTGTVLVHTYTTRANVPLQGVTIVISGRKDDGTEYLISRQLTDSSGNTAPVTVAAPPRSGSTAPGQKDAFTYVDITADMPRYERTVIRDVQIFPGIASLQAIRMIPVSGLSPQYGAAEEFTVTPQPL